MKKKEDRIEKHTNTQKPAGVKKITLIKVFSCIDQSLSITVPVQPNPPRAAGAFSQHRLGEEIFNLRLKC